MVLVVIDMDLVMCDKDPTTLMLAFSLNTALDGAVTVNLAISVVSGSMKNSFSSSSAFHPDGTSFVFKVILLALRSRFSTVIRYSVDSPGSTLLWLS